MRKSTGWSVVQQTLHTSKCLSLRLFKIAAQSSLPMMLDERSRKPGCAKFWISANGRRRPLRGGPLPSASDCVRRSSGFLSIHCLSFRLSPCVCTLPHCLHTGCLLLPPGDNHRLPCGQLRSGLTFNRLQSIAQFFIQSRKVTYI